jgi:catechol-2,3-dioxygenase
MSVTGFSHYNLRAHRPVLDTLRDFYVTVVGLQVGSRPPFRSFGYWLYAGGHDVLHLTEAPLDEGRPSNVIGTFDHVAFACIDLPVFEERLRTHGVEYTCDEVPLTGQRQLFFKDPAGNGVELNFAMTDVTGRADR